MLDPEIQYENPWDVYMNTSYILNKDIFIELGINDGLNTTIKLELGTNTITNDPMRGTYQGMQGEPLKMIFGYFSVETSGSK